MKYRKALAATLLFVVLLLGFYWVHVRFLSVDVVLYGALLDGMLAAAATAALVFRLGYFGVFNAFEKAQMTAIWLLAGALFAISVPTIIDRSLSFYILEKLQQRGGGIQLARFNEVFTREYVKEHRLVDVRLTEQEASGTVTIENGCVKLTDRGRRLATFSRFFRTHLLPRKRLLMGKYTDDLTDPFRHSEPAPDYECR